MTTSAQYWRWGLPSLVLAIVSSGLYGVSEFYVQPAIKERFLRLSLESMESVEKWDQAIAAGFDRFDVAERDSVQELEGMISEQILRLRRAELIQKRRSQLSPRDDLPLWNLFEIAEFGSRASLRVASLVGGDAAEGIQNRDYWLSQYLQFRNAMTVALERVSHLGGSLSNSARLRLLQHSLDFDAPALVDPIPLLEEISREISGLQVDERDATPLSFLRGQARMLKAFHLPSNTPRETLDLLIDEARRDFETIDGEATWFQCAWKLECEALCEPDKFLKDAAVLLSAELKRKDRDRLQLAQETDATFRVLLLLAGPDGAMDTVAARISEMSRSELALLKNLIVQSSLRVVKATELFPGSIQSRIDAGSLLKAVIRFAADAPYVIDLLRSLITDDRSLRFAAWTSAKESSGGREVLQLAQWLRGKLHDSVRNPTLDIDDVNPELVVAFLPAIAEMERLGEISYEATMSLFSDLISEYPSFLQFRIFRATIAVRKGDWKEALTEAEELSSRFPNQLEFLELLHKAKAELSRSTEDQPR